LPLSSAPEDVLVVAALPLRWPRTLVSVLTGAGFDAATYLQTRVSGVSDTEAGVRLVGLAVVSRLPYAAIRCRRSRAVSVGEPRIVAGRRQSYDSAMRIWTEDDADAARIMTRVWRWRIYGLLVIAAVVVILALVSKG
jgi:hypothetical protein